MGVLDKELVGRLATASEIQIHYASVCDFLGINLVIIAVYEDIDSFLAIKMNIWREIDLRFITKDALILRVAAHLLV